jgi:hypothetical protein
VLALAARSLTLSPGADYKSDVVNVIGNLEAHWHVLEAEINEINNDIAHLESCVRKYGASYFLSPMEYLKVRHEIHGFARVVAARSTDEGCALLLPP